MQWKVSQAKGSGTDFIGYAETSPLSLAVQDLWQKYLKDAAPINASKPWDCFGVFICLDAGSIVLFPFLKASKYRDADAKCKIICPDLLASYNEMADSNMPDDKFEAWAEDAEGKVADLISDAAKTIQLAKQLLRSEVNILYYGADSGKPFREIRLSQEK